MSYGYGPGNEEDEQSFLPVVADEHLAAARGGTLCTREGVWGLHGIADNSVACARVLQ